MTGKGHMVFVKLTCDLVCTDLITLKNRTDLIQIIINCFPYNKHSLFFESDNYTIIVSDLEVLSFSRLET